MGTRILSEGDKEGSPPGMSVLSSAPVYREAGQGVCLDCLTSGPWTDEGRENDDDDGIRRIAIET